MYRMYYIFNFKTDRGEYKNVSYSLNAQGIEVLTELFSEFCKTQSEQEDTIATDDYCVDVIKQNSVC